MDTIDTRSKLGAAFTLSWQSNGLQHYDRLYADSVSLWRDILPPSLLTSLLGQTAGAKSQVEIAAANAGRPRDPRRVLHLSPEQWRGCDQHGQSIVPRRGRFYPQGFLQGVGGVFKVSSGPCRYLGNDNGRLLFDLNHPLAGYDLQLTVEVLAVHGQRTERGGRCEDWLEKISDNGPGMQTLAPGDPVDWYRREDLCRIDTAFDQIFYQKPRLVHHLDSCSRQRLTAQYGRLITPGAQVLDLMGSWHSHLPDDLALGSLTVLGMNQQELDANRQATDRLVHDLNQLPLLPFAENQFDAVICTASLEYLVQPQAVLAEIVRVLRPGGLIAFAFSNRWFAPKAIAIWPDLHEFERLGWAAALLASEDSISGIVTLSSRGEPRPDDDPYPLPYSDPLYVVWGKKR